MFQNGQKHFKNLAAFACTNLAANVSTTFGRYA